MEDSKILDKRITKYWIVLQNNEQDVTQNIEKSGH
jgi:hypothetical protein